MIQATTQTIRPSNTIDVEPRSDKSVVITPPPNFNLRRFLIEEDIAKRFLITGIAFGKNNQLLGPGSIPALLFSAGGLHHSYDFDHNLVGDDIKISATNITTEPHPFFVVAIGDLNEHVSIPNKTNPPTHVHRRTFLGLGHTSIPPEQSAIIAVQPAYAFRTEELFIPSTIAKSFVVRGIKVGHMDQMLTSSPIPGQLFTEKVIPPATLKLDVCAPQVFLSLSVDNLSKTHQNFNAAFVGTALVEDQ